MKKIRPWRRKGSNKKCEMCSREFYVPRLVNKIGKGRFCSKKCWYQSRKKEIIRTCLNCEKNFITYPSRLKQSPTKYCSAKCHYKHRIGKFIGENATYWKGGPHKCKYCKKELGYKGYVCKNCHTKYLIKRGKDSSFWRGGITPIHLRIRESAKYKAWRKTVYKRDDFTCVWCGYKGDKLQADHIKPFAFFPELRFEVNNGRTLCVECHKKTDTYGKNKFTSLHQL